MESDAKMLSLGGGMKE